ncbi:MAG: hypothetical protein QHJ82_13040, partial [Verrucomicrobiota bacterium]|nr:hypothetical protein [Verrucomicrobiota bacterium]
GISVLFLATESQGKFPSPAWLKVRGQEPGCCPSGDFGFGYAGLRNMRARKSHRREGTGESEGVPGEISGLGGVGR